MRGQESAMEERRVRVNRQWRPTLVGADQWNSIKMQMDFVPRRREQCETRRPLGRGAFQFLRSVFVLFCLVFFFFFGFFFCCRSSGDDFDFQRRLMVKADRYRVAFFVVVFCFVFFFGTKRGSQRARGRKKETKWKRKKERKVSIRVVHPSGTALATASNGLIRSPIDRSWRYGIIANTIIPC